MISSLLFNLLIFLLLLCVAVTIGLYLYFQKQYQHWGKRKVPHAKPSFPLGNLSGVKDNSIWVILKRIYDESKNERYYGFWQLHRPALMINDPDLIKRILVADFMNFQDRGLYFNEKDDPLSGNLFSLEGTAWRSLRVKLTPVFTSGKMKMMFPILVECGKELEGILMEHAKIADVVDVKEYVARFGTDMISSCAFGLEANSLKNPESVIRNMGRKIFEPTWNVTLRNLIAGFVPDLAKLLKLRVNSKEVADFFLKTFQEVIEYREKNNIKRNDAMQLLIELMNKGYIDDPDNRNKNDEEVKKEKFTFLQLAAQAFLFFVGGFETTSTTIQFTLYELAKNHEIQTKLRNEINRIIAKHDGQITYEAIYEMEYLGRVMDETLRKYSPAAGIPRICNREYKDPESDLVIEKGTVIVISTLGLHRDERHFPDPERFDPDRFTEEQKASRHHYAYLPFGEGPRVCIGRRLADMQTRVGLIALLSKFKFDISEKYSPNPLEFDPKSFFLSPKGGMLLRISLAYY